MAAAILAAVLSFTACAGPRYPVTPVQRGGRSATPENTGPRMDMLQLDNQATVYVDVYLVTDQQVQWRLGRIPAGMSERLKVPESAMDWTTGFVQLAIIPGSRMSAEAWRDPRAVIAIAQPVSAVLAQRWTFRQPAGAGVQQQAMPCR